MRKYKIIIEKHRDGYVAYPLGMKGVAVGQGETYEQALEDATSAIKFHVESFGPEVLDIENEAQAAFIAEAEVDV